MILHKIFHLKSPVNEAKAMLMDVRAYRSRLEDIHRLTQYAGGESAWTVSLPGNLTADLRIRGLKADNENLVLFASTEGDVRVQGMIEFVPIRDGLTQVELTINYRLNSFVGRWADRFTNLVERFVDKQLTAVRAHFEGLASVESSSRAGRRRWSRRLAPQTASA